MSVLAPALLSMILIAARIGLGSNADRLYEVWAPAEPQHQDGIQHNLQLLSTKEFVQVTALSEFDPGDPSYHICIGLNGNIIETQRPKNTYTAELFGVPYLKCS